MKNLLRHWRWCALVLSLGALGCVLHVALPILPRWQVQIHGTLRPDIFWDDGRGTVRLVGHERGCLLVLDSASGRERARYDPSESESVGYTFSPDGRLAVEVTSGKQKRLRWIDLDDHSESGEEFDGEITWMRFSPTGEYLALLLVTPSQEPETLDMLVLECITRTKVLQRTVPEMSLPAFLPGERRMIFSACDKDTGSYVFDLETQSEVSRLPGACSTYRLSPDGTRLVTGLWSMDDLGALWDFSNPVAPRRLASLMDCFPEFSQDSFWCAVYNLDSRKNELWDIRAGARVLEFEGNSLSFLFSPDSRYLGSYSWGDDKEEFRLVDLQTRTVLWRRFMYSCPRFDGPRAGPPPSRINTRPAFTPDSRFVILPGAGAAFDVVATASGELVLQFAPGEGKSIPPEPQFSESGLVLFTSERSVESADESTIAVLDTWLARLLGKVERSPKFPVSVINPNVRQELLRLEVGPSAEANLSPNGRAVLITENGKGGATSITCWDVPARRPWRWILGIPFGLLAMMLSVGWLRRRLRLKPQATAA